MFHALCSDLPEVRHWEIDGAVRAVTNIKVSRSEDGLGTRAKDIGARQAYF